MPTLTRNKGFADLMTPFFLLLALFSWLAPSSVEGQVSPAPARYSIERIIELHINYVPCLRLVSLVRANGVSFEATDDALRRLKSAKNSEREAICDTALDEIRSAAAMFAAEEKIKQERAIFAAKIKAAEELAKIREHIMNGEARLDQGDYTKAIAEFKEALSVDHPNNKEARAKLDIANSARKAESSLRPGPLGLSDIERLLAGRITPKRVTSLVSERKISFDTLPNENQKKLRDAGADNEVIAAIRILLPPVITGSGTRPPPEEAVVLVNRGKAVARQKIPNYEEALKLFEQALKISEGYGEAWALKGDALRGLKRFQDAINSYDRALALNKRDAATWSTKAIAHKELAQHNEAVQSFDRLLELSPLNVGAWIRRGDSLVELKRCEEARKSYDRALNVDPTYHLTLEAHYERLKSCGA